jgi:hypothetical protein
MTLVTNMAYILRHFGLSRLVAINVDTICHLATEYHCFLWLEAWATWFGVAVVGALCTRQCKYILFYILWKRIESFNEYYLMFYWMLLLLLSEVNNTAIVLMTSLNAINGKSRWLSSMATLLSLLLAIGKRPTQFVGMAWHPQRDLAPRFFNNALVEDKTIGCYCHNTGQHQLFFSGRCAPCQLLLYCGLRKISSGPNLAPESLCAVCASGALQGAQVSDPHCPVTNKVDCCEEFYSFTNQAFVAWCLGTCQEWWRSLAQSRCSTWWCGDRPCQEWWRSLAWSTCSA